VRRWNILWIALVIVVIDRVLKIWVARTMVVGQSITVIPYILNSGAAFSLLRHSTFLFVVVAFILLIGVAYVAWRVRELPGRAIWGLGLLAGGATGNLWDRLISGRVIDYIHIRFWAVFNLADSAIVGGMLLLVWEYWRRQDGERDVKTARNSGGSSER
jgi:signal peptidase II